MKLVHKIVSTAALSALVSTAVISVPVLAVNSEQQAPVVVTNVVIETTDGQVVVDIRKYGTAVIFKNKDYEFLKDGKEFPKITALEVGNKFVDLKQYGTKIVFGKDPAQAVSELNPIPTDGFKEYKGLDESGTPILEDVVSDTVEFKVLDISSAIDGKAIEAEFTSEFGGKATI